MLGIRFRVQQLLRQRVALRVAVFEQRVERIDVEEFSAGVGGGRAFRWGIWGFFGGLEFGETVVQGLVEGEAGPQWVFGPEGEEAGVVFC
jgi:hypothetical protein